MGRHRRSATGRATHHEGPCDGGPDLPGEPEDGPPARGTAPYPNPDAHAETYTRSEAYSYGTDDSGVYSAAHDFAQGGFPAGSVSDRHFPVGDIPDRGFPGGGFPAPVSSPSGFPGSTVSDDGFPTGQDRPGPAFTGDGGPPADGFAGRGGMAFFDDFGSPGVPPSSERPFPGPGGSGDSGNLPAGGHRRRKKKKAGTPVRTGLLGVSAAMAIGTIAVATGTVPGLENYRLGGDRTPGEDVQAGGTATGLPGQQGGTSGTVESPSGDASIPAGGSDTGKPSTSPSTSPSASATPTKTPEKREEQEKKSSAPPKEPSKQAQSREKTPEQEKKPDDSPNLSAEAAAAAEVLRLVNAERATAGCSPVTANSALAELATAFSDDMAERDFFDHTDPDGDTPWDRAEAAGISNLGGENIARGQPDAGAVMEAWMNSPGHRKNILNCDFKTLGVGVHMGPGGPWWTQNFGY